MSALIPTMIGKHHLKPDMPDEFFEQSVTKMLDHYNEQLVCKEIDKNTYFEEKAKINEAKDRLECVEQRLDIHERQYQ